MGISSDDREVKALDLKNPIGFPCTGSNPAHCGDCFYPLQNKNNMTFFHIN